MLHLTCASLGRLYSRGSISPSSSLHLRSRKNLSTATRSRTLNADTIPLSVKNAEYAVRGEVVIKAEQLSALLQQQRADGQRRLPFDDIVYCNIGNPQSLGQQPITYFRQFVSLMHYPAMSSSSAASSLYPADVLQRAQKALLEIPEGIHQRSDSQGLHFVRRDIAEFIERRDGFSSDPRSIFLYNGASPAVQSALRLAIRGPKDGVLIPIPQYPLYSASIALLGGSQVGYYLQEETNWGLSLQELERSLAAARTQGVDPRCLVIINPGNPTGQTLKEDNMREIIDFCHRRKLVLLADEVYQENVYVKQDKPFKSFKKVLRSMGSAYDNVELISFHSISKGFMGECGQRSGYLEAVGVHSDVLQQLKKLANVEKCANITGQLLMDVMVKPPQAGDASHALYVKERDAIYNSLKRRAEKLAGFLNTLQGVSCNPAEGAMYLFPQITLPAAAVQAAAQHGKQPDTFYVLSLLENTGLCVVPGSGFGQKSGTYHFRTTFLPPEDKIDGVMDRMRTFHENYMRQYSS